MRLPVVDRLRCPRCLAQGRASPFEPDPTREGGGEDGGRDGDLLEGFLVCAACRRTWPLLTGLPILPRDLASHLRTHGNVYRRTPIGDPRLTRFVLGQAREGGDVVPFAEVLARYGDLLPFDPDAPPRAGSALDLALDDALRRLQAAGPALEVGCGVGRATFVLAGRVGEAIGLDRSVARVRRARNVLTATEFRLPTRDDSRLETPVDLTRLARDGVEFLVADPDALPFDDGAFATVLVQTGDGDGPWADPEAVRREARRVTGPGGLLLLARASSSGVVFEEVHAPRAVS